jgi:hypothetical protein
MHPAALARFLFCAVLLAPSLHAEYAEAAEGAENAQAASAPMRSTAAAAPLASSVRIHLHGAPRIDAHVARSQGKLVVSGTVSDDLGGATRALGAARVAIEIAGPAPSAALVDLAASAPEMCTDVNQAPVLEGAARMLVPTAASAGTARFCIRLAVPRGRYVVHLESPASGLVDAARLELPVDLGLEAVRLRFDPEVRARSLDDDVVPVGVAASTEDDGITHAAVGFPVTLVNEAGDVLGAAVTDQAGAARFAVAGPRLGPAGRGELRVTFAGSAVAGPSASSAVVDRQMRVALAFPEAAGGRLPAGSAGSSFVLHVVAVGVCAARGCSGAPTGTIEVRAPRDASGGADDGVYEGVGAASLRDGKAEVVMTFGAAFARGGEAELRVRYHPDAPWFIATETPALVQPLEPPSPWREYAFAGAGLLVAAWLVVSRLSMRPRAARRASPAPAGVRAGVAVVHAQGPPGECRGRVTDAHDGSAVGGARIAHERPGFESSRVVWETMSDPTGAFVLPATDVQPGDQLVAEGAWHASMRMPMPTGGELLVTLIARRRALLERLVAWARRRGAPFDAVPEPTPEHVRRVAGRTRGVGGAGGAGGERGPDGPPVGSPHVRNVAIEAWAGAVERAAFGGEPVDAHREAEVDGLAPPDASGPGPRAR